MPSSSTKHKISVKKKIKTSHHPFDKWITRRAELEEYVVGRKAVMKTIADFIKAVLPKR